MPHYVYAIIGISLIFVCTTLGALLVFFFKGKNISEKLNIVFVGFAAGVMLSAAFFSLIKPALEEKVEYMPSYAIVAISVIVGALFMWLIDKTVPHIHESTGEEEGIRSDKISKMNKMFLAVTIHNIPEGLSVGIAFGVALATQDYSMVLAALFLAVGMGLQNIPEGAAVSLPIKSETGDTKKAFIFGALSGAVEPVAAVVGLFLAMQIQVIMPWALSFAAGCMIYVIVEEMIPELKSDTLGHFGVWSFIIGFVVMMVLDCIQW